MYLKMGMKVPAPQGKQWRELVEQRNLKHNNQPRVDTLRANEAIIEVVSKIERDVKLIQALTRQTMTDEENIDARQARKAKKKRKRKKRKR